MAAVGASAERLIADLNYLGLLFESLAVRDLRAYAQALAANVLDYRDSNGLKVDAIVERADGKWAAFEIKLGGREQENQGAASLLAFRKQIDVDRCGEPSVLVVLTGTGGYSYRRPDGVVIVPLVRLGP